MQDSVLIVEDECITAMDLQNSLEKLHYQVVGIATSGEEAIAMANHYLPKLILMDISLSGHMSGAEAAKSIVSNLSIPIIFVTAYNDFETFREAKVSNPYGYLTKPFDERDLAIAVELALFKLKMELESTADTMRVQHDFLANMSHEMRTPLNGIIGFSALLQTNQLGELTRHQQQYMGYVVSSAKHLLALVDNVLDLSKIELGKLLFFPEAIDLKSLIQEVLDTVSVLIVEKSLTFHVRIDDSLRDVFLDPLKLKQVVYNYVTNAVKFSKEQACIEVLVFEKNDRYFSIEVRDQGIGIAEEQMKQLFIPFNQLSQQKNKIQQGAGLGLAIVKRLVEAQGGSVGVQSNQGVGSVFYATLPRHFQ